MKDTIKHWIQAIRPKTLAASASPVIIGCALAYKSNSFKLGAAILCAGVAIFAQISSNLANDYFDFIHGIDNIGRKGPERVSSSGKIKPERVITAAVITLISACIFGLCLLFYADWTILLVGIGIALCVIGYSAGPFPLSHHALGDVAVMLFYGIIPVCFTYYVQTGYFTLMSLIYSAAIGLLAVNILLVNNYRDIDNDRSAGKITTLVLWGKKFGIIAYLINSSISAIILILLNFSFITIIFMIIFLSLSVKIWIKMKKREGKELNPVLADTALNLLIYTLFCSTGIIIG